MKTDVPEVFIRLGPELLISEHWDSLPPPSSSWTDQRLSSLREWIEDEPWRKWDAEQWINALVFVGVGLAVLGNVATFIAEVRRASAIR
jgi:hypothetical protein